MYEQYTDKQIVEMLAPKLMKAVPEVNWDAIKANSDFHNITNKMIATIYRSAYIRGQLGRSFIIGEKNKQNGHWVPATRDNVKKGDKVRYLNAKRHEQNPEFYPSQGTIGKVVSVVDDNTYLVQWPDYTTARFANRPDLEVLVCE